MPKNRDYNINQQPARVIAEIKEQKFYKQYVKIIKQIMFDQNSLSDIFYLNKVSSGYVLNMNMMYTDYLKIVNLQKLHGSKDEEIKTLVEVIDNSILKAFEKNELNKAKKVAVEANVAFKKIMDDVKENIASKFNVKSGEDLDDNMLWDIIKETDECKHNIEIEIDKNIFSEETETLINNEPVNNHKDNMIGHSKNDDRNNLKEESKSSEHNSNNSQQQITTENKKEHSSKNSSQNNSDQSNSSVKNSNHNDSGSMEDSGQSQEKSNSKDSNQSSSSVNSSNQNNSGSMEDNSQNQEKNGSKHSSQSNSSQSKSSVESSKQDNFSSAKDSKQNQEKSDLSNSSQNKNDSVHLHPEFDKNYNNKPELNINNGSILQPNNSENRNSQTSYDRNGVYKSYPLSTMNSTTSFDRSKYDKNSENETNYSSNSMTNIEKLTKFDYEAAYNELKRHNYNIEPTICMESQNCISGLGDNSLLKVGFWRKAKLFFWMLFHHPLVFFRSLFSNSGYSLQKHALLFEFRNHYNKRVVIANKSSGVNQKTSVFDRTRMLIPESDRKLSNNSERAENK